MISFGRDGISGHIDHISAGKVAKAVAKKLKVPYLTFAAPPELLRSIEQLKKRRKHGKYVKRIDHRPHDIEIKVDPVKKLRALQLHRSQLDKDGPLANFPDKTVKQVLNFEYYSF